MKNILTIASTLCVGLALTLSACGKDKKPSTTEPAATEPAKTDPAKPDPAATEAKPEEKKADAKGGW
jgi:ABC-type oligopeptide transport system substrate-binding subunit